MTVITALGTKHEGWGGLLATQYSELTHALWPNA
jgi:hypothetical protein